MFKQDHPPAATKVAGFDMVVHKSRNFVGLTAQDYTLISTKSGRKFPTGQSDWQWWSDRVVPKLRDLHASGYTIIVFTNQMGIEYGLIATELRTTQY